MLRTLNNKTDINVAQNQFVNRFNKIIDKDISVIIGYPGGNFKSNVSWISKLGIWICSYPRKGKHVNLFGVGKPTEGSMIPKQII
jgi:hypothetical protein